MIVAVLVEVPDADADAERSTGMTLDAVERLIGALTEGGFQIRSQPAQVLPSRVRIGERNGELTRVEELGELRQ